MTDPRYGHTATLLRNGLVLVSGGRTTGAAILATAELYDPNSGAFSPAGSMTTGRYGHTATPLLDGRVVIVGGQDSSGRFVGSAELYLP
jgi:hypothetical protein